MGKNSFLFQDSLFQTGLFIGSKPYQKDSLLLLGLPTDSSTCFRPGARFGPDDIRKYSDNLETFSMYQNADLEDTTFTDLGNLLLPRTNGKAAFHVMRTAAKEIYQKNHRALFFGGDHSITYPLLAGITELHPDICIVHLDAHADLRTQYEGEKYSHACSMGNSLTLFQNQEKRLFQLGIRSAAAEEYSVMQKLSCLYDLNSLDEIREGIADRPVYLSIDLDIFDPGIFPGTGTPETGGWFFQDFIKFIPFLKSLQLIGADIVELAPIYDTSGASSALACKVVREILLIMKQD